MSPQSHRPDFWRGRPWRLRAAALALAAAVVGLLQLVFPAGFAAPEEWLGDWTWRIGASSRPERRVVIVDIDEASLERIGPWPWPRASLARLSARLEDAGATVQVFDMVLDAPRPGDAELAALWARTPVVAGQVFSLSAQSTPRVGVPADPLSAAGCPAFAPLSHGYVANSATLEPARLTIGHLTPEVGDDGVVRQVPALICHEGRAYPSLALAALWRAAQAGSAASPLAAAPDWSWLAPRTMEPGAAPASLPGLTPPHQLWSPSLPGVEVPLDDKGMMRVPYRVDRRAFASIPAHRVLDGDADAAVLRGAIVLVGATGFGIVDVTATPLSPVAAGVEVHAQALAGMLDHRVPYLPQGAPWLQLLAGVVAAALLLAVSARGQGAPVRRLPLAGLSLAAALAAGAAAALWLADLWLPWAAPTLFVLLAASALATAEHALTRAQRERLFAHLGSYLPSPVAQRLMKVDPSGSIQFEQRHVSVLVADIRNFSAFAAHRPTEETAALLHAYYCLAVDVVEEHGGVVENVVGDSITAVWNAYADDCPEHPQRAFDAARELVRATRALLANPVLSDKEPLVQPLALGIGLETGAALVGSFGPTRRRSHAALGEPVGVASRLQQMTQDLSMPVLLGPTMARRLPRALTECLGDYLLEGMSLQCSLFVPADWAELVPCEQLWAAVTQPGAGSPIPADGDGPLLPLPPALYPTDRLPVAPSPPLPPPPPSS